MTTYSTGNPVGAKGSADPRDLYDNSENLDKAINGPDSTWVDRLGNSRKTFKAAENAADAAEAAADDAINTLIPAEVSGVEAAADDAINDINALDAQAQQALDNAEASWETRFVDSQDDKEDRFVDSQDDRQAQFVQLMISGGYTGTGADGAVESYAAGITVSAYKEIISDGGEFWRAAADTTLPYTTTGAGMPEGGAFVNVGDGVLRQDLVQPVATFNNVADMKAATGLGVGRKCRTLGYYEPGDGGGNDGEIVAAGTGTDDGGSYIDLAGSGLQAKGLFVNGVISVGRFGAKDAVDSQSAIESAVSYAKSNGVDLYWEDGEFVSTGNIPSFHDVRHFGEGRINRNGNIWHISPKWDDVNELHVSEGGILANDGFSSGEPTSFVGALGPARNFGKIGKWGHATHSGVWRVRLHGTMTNVNGAKLDELPYFSRPLEIRGEGVVSQGDEPTTIWDGASVTERAAIRAENTTALLNIHLKNIKFINWAWSAVWLYGAGDIQTENCWASDCGLSGFNYRNAHVRHSYGEISNCSPSITATNHCWGRIEFVDFVGGPVNDIRISRLSTIGVRDCIFRNSGGDCISITKNSRCRTERNEYIQYGRAAIAVLQGSIHDGSEGADADILTGVGVGKPVHFSNMGGVVEPVLSSGISSHVHFNSLEVIGNVDAGTRVLLNDRDGYGAPFRIRGYSLYSESLKIELSLFGRLDANTSVLIELALGPNASDVIAELSIPSESASRSGEFKFNVFGIKPSNSNGRSHAIATLANSGIHYGATSFSAADVASQSSNEILGRLYVTIGSGSSGGMRVEQLHTTLIP